MPIQIDTKHLEPLSHIEFIARQVVEGFITGLHKSPFHGFSVEFAEHRLYNKGESTRHIDWKLFGRTEKLFVKRYEEETNLRCQIVIDDSSSMLFPFDVENQFPGKLNKLGFSAYSAAAIIYLLKKQLDATGLSVFSDKLHVHTPAKSTQQHLKLMFANLDELLSKSKEKTGERTLAVDSLHVIAESVHKRSLVVIFSDMLDNQKNLEQIFAALQHLKYNKHEVLLFHTIDKRQELEFEWENRPYTFVDSESGEEIKLNPQQVKEQYRAQIQQYANEIKLKCAAYKIDYIEADINQGFEQVLYAYLVKRGSML